VAKGSAAERGGILPGDTLMAINGSAFDSWESFVTLIQGSTGKAVLLTVKRGMQTLDVDLVPDTQIDKQGRSIGVLGVSPTQAKWPENMRISLEYGIVDSILPQ
jgi:regulator of sigma E protease